MVALLYHCNVVPEMKSVKVFRTRYPEPQRATLQQHSGCNHRGLYLVRDSYYNLTIVIGVGSTHGDGSSLPSMSGSPFALLPLITPQPNFKSCQAQSKEGVLKSLVIFKDLLLRIWEGIKPTQLCMSKSNFILLSLICRYILCVTSY